MRHLYPNDYKLVRNVTADGNNAPFKTATTVRKGDLVDYQSNITQPSGQQLDRVAVFEDVLDSHLKFNNNKELSISYSDENGVIFMENSSLNLTIQWRLLGENLAIEDQHKS